LWHAPRPDSAAPNIKAGRMRRSARTAAEIRVMGLLRDRLGPSVSCRRGDRRYSEMDIKPTILDAVGNTPLVRLNKVVPKGAATVLVKCEFMNPTGSIKDRMALHILNESEKMGKIKPGGTIVENTSGNTGLGVAMWAAVKGYRCVFTMPDKMSL